MLLGNVSGQVGAVNGAIGTSISANGGDGVSTVTGTISSVGSVISMFPGLVGVGGNALSVGMTIAKTGSTGPLTLADILSVASGLAGILSGLAVTPGVIIVAGVASVGLGVGSIVLSINDYRDSKAFSDAKKWTWPRDPIILDLDGDGLETVGLASNIHFDFDADGVLTKTGWAGKDDALLVWDRNANGSIDTGAELFGDFTVLPNGSLAPNGFAALAALDANGDGILDATDPAFAELRLWRDTDQEGVTGAGELIPLQDAGIVSLNLANTLKNQGLSNGNQLTREGSFTRADGTTGGMGEYKLATDTFDTRFAEEIDVPEALRTLPNMGGSGNVRELQQAAAQSGSLADVLTQFQAAGTRAEQKALLDTLLDAWADTSNLAESLEERAAGKYRIQYDAFGNERRSANLAGASAGATYVSSTGGSTGGGSGSSTGGGSISSLLLNDAENPLLNSAYRKLIADWSRKLHVLEAFNGQYFFNLPTQKSQTDGANWGMSVRAGSASGGGGGGGGGMAVTIEALPTLLVSYSQPQLDLLQQAYDSLKESVYASLVLQTRLKPYLDQIELVIDENGLRLDAAQLNQTFADKRTADPENALADLLDLDRYAGSMLAGTNWDGMANFDTLLETLPSTPGIAALLSEFKVRTLTGGDDKSYLTSNADIVLAGGSRHKCRWQGEDCANWEWRMAA